MAEEKGYRSYEERRNTKRFVVGGLSLAAFGAAIYYRKNLVKTALKGFQTEVLGHQIKIGGIKDFINREVGGLETAALSALKSGEQEYRPAARLAWDLSNSLGNIEGRARQSRAAGFLFHDDRFHKFRKDWGLDDLKKAVGVGPTRKEMSDRLYREAFAGIGETDPAKAAKLYDNLALKPQFQRLIEKRSVTLGGGVSAEITAREELARVLEQANSLAAQQAKDAKYNLAAGSKRNLLALLDEQYLAPTAQDSVTDRLLGDLFGIRRRRLKEDSSYDRAREVLLEGIDNKHGALQNVLDPSERVAYFKRLGESKSNLLLNVDGEDFDLSALPAALSNWYNRQRPTWQLPASPGMKGFTPFSFFPHLRGQSPKVIHEIPATASMPWLDGITNNSQNPLGHPGHLYVVGRKTGPLHFDGRGKFLGDGLIYGTDRSVEQETINQSLKNFGIDLRDARSGFLKTYSHRSSRAAARRNAGPGGLTEEGYDTRTLLGQFLDKHNLSGGPLDTLRSIDHRLSNFFTPGGQGDPSLWQELHSIGAKFNHPDWLPNVYKNRILKSNRIDSEAMAQLLSAMKSGRAGYIDPEDITRLINGDDKGLFTDAPTAFKRVMAGKDAVGKPLFLSDHEVISFFANHEIDLKDIKTDELRRAMQTFRREPETALAYGRNNDNNSPVEGILSGLFGEGEKSQGIQHLRETLVAELSRHGQGTGNSLYDRVMRAGNDALSPKEKVLYGSFLKGHDLSQMMNEDIQGVYESFRGTDTKAGTLRNLVENFFDYQFHPLAPFVKGVETSPDDRWLVSLRRPKPAFRLHHTHNDPDAIAGLSKDIAWNTKRWAAGQAKGVRNLYGDLRDVFATGRTFGERLDSLKSIGHRLGSTEGGRGVRSLVRGMDDPDAMTDGSMTPYFFAARLNDQFLAPLGLGLGQDDMSSAGKIVSALLLKRALPAYLGVRLLDRMDYESEQLGVPGPDELAANLRAKSNLGFRKFLDEFGLTNRLKRLKQLMPGSEEFFDFRPTSEAEYLEYLDHGRDPVRKGRNWLFGSRTAYAGEGVSYYEPNYYLRAHSDWETATGGPRAKESFYNPFDPYAQEKASSIGPYAARPYPLTAPLVDPHFAFAPLINNTLGLLLKPQKRINQDAEETARPGGSTQFRDPLATAESFYYGSSSVGGNNLPGDGTLFSSANNNPLVQSSNNNSPASLVTIGAGGTFSLQALPGGMVPEPYLNTYHGKAEPGRSLSRKQVERLNRKLQEMGTGLTNLPHPQRNIGTGQNTQVIDPRSLGNQRDLLAYQAQQMGGIYGFMYGLLPGQDFGSPERKLILADASAAYGIESRYWDADRGGSFLGIAGLGLDQPLNELVRRFIPHRRKSLETVNNIPNIYSGSDWLPTSDTYFIDFQKGDALSKIKRGMTRLPGEAYRKLYRTEILTLRASSAGKSVEEMVDQMTNRREPLTEHGEYVTTLGTELHVKVEAAMKAAGYSVVNEATVADKKLGIKGHIDMVLKTDRGYEISDLKTVSEEKFNKLLKQGHAFEEHLRQIAVYQHITGIKKGRLFYASRDSGRVIDMNSDYSEKRFQSVMKNAETARKIVLDKLNRREISEAELYDDVTRYEILSDVALYSPERKALEKSLSHSDQLSGQDKERIAAAKERASIMRKRVETFDYRFKDSDDRLMTKEYVVDRIEDAKFIYVKGQENPLRLAGGRVSESAIQKWLEEKGRTVPEGEDPITYFYRLQGISAGKRIRVKTDSDPALRYRNDTARSQRVVIGNLNRRLIQSGVMSEDENDYTPTGVEARFSHKEQLFGSFWETITHADTPLNTKFSKIRSPLEAYERQVVYGTTEGSWEAPFKTYVWPTLSGIANKNPVGAALHGAFLATLPFVLSKHKKTAALVGAGIGATLSLSKSLYELVAHKPFIPSGLNRRREVEEYYDILNYMKERSLFEKKADLAKEKEGVDIRGLIDKYENLAGWRKKRKRELQDEERTLKRKGGSEERLRQIKEEMGRVTEPIATLALGPLATQALQHRANYRRTMYGAEPGSPLMDVLGSMSKNERDILTDALDSPQKDKDKLFTLLSSPQKRLLGLHLGQEISDLPERPRLMEYFKDHQLPGIDSRIWDEDVSLADLRTRAYDEEGFRKVELGIYPQVLAKAEERTQGVEVPYPNAPTRNIQQNLNTLLSGKSSGQKFFTAMTYDTPSWKDTDEIEVNLHMKENRRREMQNNINERY